MSFTISINDQAAFEVLFAGPAGPTGPQGIQGIQGVPGPGVAAGGTTGQVLKKLSSTNYDTGWSSDISGVAWGAITGTLSAQTDLQTALDAKLSTSAASSTYLPLAGGYITGDIQSLNGSEFRTFQGTNSAIIRSYQIQMGDAVGSLTIDAEGISFNSSPFKQTLPFLGLAGYATEGWVTSNFYPLTGNPSGFLTSAPVTSVAGKVGAVTLDNTDISGLGTLAVVNDAPSDGTIYGRKDGSWTSTISSVAWGEITGTLSYQLDLQTALNLKLDATVAATTYYLQTNPDGFITSAALTGYATETFVTTQGYITQTTADGLYYPLSGNPSGFIGDAPSDGSTYGRNNGAWTVTGGGGLITSVTSPLAVNSGDLSIDLAGYATESWVQSQGYLTSVPPPTLTNLTGDISWDSSAGIGRLIIDGVVDLGGGFSGARVSFSSGVPTQPATGDFWFNGTDFFYAGGGVKTIASQSWVTSLGYASLWQLSNYALLAGATFSGKVNTTITGTTAPINIGSQLTAPTTTVAGDLWIGANINYKSWDGVTKAVANTNTTNQFTQGQAITVNSAVNAFRINQQGTGPALVVEDSVSPDATPFVIDANGKVGVGIAPDATAAIKVDANGISFNGLVFNPTATAAHTGGSDTLDLLVTINGTNYRLGLRPA
jgi:hypothetical protein